jgi:hypothetical protein
MTSSGLVSFDSSAGKLVELPASGSGLYFLEGSEPGKSGSIIWKNSFGETHQQITGNSLASSRRQLYMTTGSEVGPLFKLTGDNVAPYDAAASIEYLGSFARVLVNAQEESDFLQLTATAKRNVNAGASSAEFPGAKFVSNIVQITHGLGATPICIDVITEASEAATVPITPRIISKSSTVFKVRLYSPVEVAKTTINFLWKAIG